MGDYRRLVAFAAAAFLALTTGACGDRIEEGEFEFATKAERTAAAEDVSTGKDTSSDAGSADAGSVDSGTVDSVSVDAGYVDSGSVDAGPVDAGPVDSGSVDAGPVDSGSLDSGADSGPADIGTVDSVSVDSGPADAGAIDSGSADSGPVDSGPVDSGPVDSGAVDSGAVDSGSADSGPADAGTVDSGPVDSGSADSGPVDAGAVDSGPVDSGSVDSGPVDSGSVDAGVSLDSGTPDAATPDAGPIDAGSPCSNKADGTICGAKVGCVEQRCKSGACMKVAMVCDDGNACTKPDACIAGVCKSGPSIKCDDGNVCTKDSCDAGSKSKPGKGCTHTHHDGATCSDGDDCTTDDSCAAGSCTANATYHESMVAAQTSAAESWQAVVTLPARRAVWAGHRVPKGKTGTFAVVAGTDRTASEKWTADFASVNSRFDALVATPDHGSVACGRVSADGKPTSEQLLLVGHDAAGKQQWVAQQGKGVRCAGIARRKDGMLAAIAATSAPQAPTFVPSSVFGSDSKGKQLWTASYSSSSNRPDIRAIVSDGSGRFVAGGTWKKTYNSKPSEFLWMINAKGQNTGTVQLTEGRIEALVADKRMIYTVATTSAANKNKLRMRGIDAVKRVALWSVQVPGAAGVVIGGMVRSHSGFLISASGKLASQTKSVAWFGFVDGKGTVTGQRYHVGSSPVTVTAIAGHGKDAFEVAGHSGTAGKVSGRWRLRTDRWGYAGCKAAGKCAAQAKKGCSDSNECTWDSCEQGIGCGGKPKLNASPCKSGAGKCFLGAKCNSGVCKAGGEQESATHITVDHWKSCTYYCNDDKKTGTLDVKRIRGLPDGDLVGIASHRLLTTGGYQTSARLVRLAPSGQVRWKASAQDGATGKYLEWADAVGLSSGDIMLIGRSRQLALYDGWASRLWFKSASNTGVQGQLKGGSVRPDGSVMVYGEDGKHHAMVALVSATGTIGNPQIFAAGKDRSVVFDIAHVKGGGTVLAGQLWRPSGKNWSTHLHLRSATATGTTTWSWTSKQSMGLSQWANDDVFGGLAATTAGYVITSYKTTQVYMIDNDGKLVWTKDLGMRVAPRLNGGFAVMGSTGALGRLRFYDVFANVKHTATTALVNVKLFSGTPNGGYVGYGSGKYVTYKRLAVHLDPWAVQCSKHGSNCAGKKPADCDDGNPCTWDTCTGSGGCQNTPGPTFTACGNGGACVAGKCVAPAGKTCKDVLAKNKSSGDGLYLLDPDGAGPVLPAKLHCDMKNGGKALLFNFYDSELDDMPNTSAPLAAGWYIEDAKKTTQWQTGSAVVSPKLGKHVSAAVGPGFVKALVAAGGGKHLRMCLYSEFGQSETCRSSDGAVGKRLTITAAPASVGNTELKRYRPSVCKDTPACSIAYTFGRIAGLPGSTDSLLVSNLNGGAYAVPVDPGGDGVFGSANNGLMQASNVGVWRANNTGAALSPAAKATKLEMPYGTNAGKHASSYGLRIWLQ